MKRYYIGLLFIMFVGISKAQTKTVNIQSFLINKSWFIDFVGYQRTKVGQDYGQNKKTNLLIFKSNGDYSLKYDEVERSGRYLIQNGLIFLYNGEEPLLETSLAMDEDKCVVFKFKVINQNSFQMSTISALEVEGWDYLVKKYLN